MSDSERVRLWQLMLQHSRMLVAFVIGAGLLLTFSYDISSERIARQRSAAERRVLDEVFPAALHDNDLLAAAFDIDAAGDGFQQLALLGLSSPRPAWRASLQGEATGVILPVETAGFSGPVLLLIGIDADAVITGVRVIQHRETPGLGDRIDADESPWIRGFNNRSLENTPPVLWQVKKDGGDFDQFVGATVTPRAVVAGIYNALLFFEANRDQLLQAARQ